MELSETGGRTIRRTRSSADCKLRGKTEPNEPLNDRALKLIISHRFKLAGAHRSTLGADESSGGLGVRMTDTCPLMLLICSADSLRRVGHFASGRSIKTNNKQQAKLTPSDSAKNGGEAREVIDRNHRYLV